MLVLPGLPRCAFHVHAQLHNVEGLGPRLYSPVQAIGRYQKYLWAMAVGPLRVLLLIPNLLGRPSWMEGKQQ